MYPILSDECTDSVIVVFVGSLTKICISNTTFTAYYTKMNFNIEQLKIVKYVKKWNIHVYKKTNVLLVSKAYNKKLNTLFNW